jgi:hypothetical protein
MMARRIFEFKCANQHTFEKFIDSEVKETVCPSCGLMAKRIISPVRLDWRMGVDSDMPTMAEKWSRMHENAAKTRKDEN